MSSTTLHRIEPGLLRVAEDAVARPEVIAAALRRIWSIIATAAPGRRYLRTFRSHSTGWLKSWNAWTMTTSARSCRGNRGSSTSPATTWILASPSRRRIRRQPVEGAPADVVGIDGASRPDAPRHRQREVAVSRASLPDHHARHDAYDVHRSLDVEIPAGRAHRRNRPAPEPDTAAPPASSAANTMTTWWSGRRGQGTGAPSQRCCCLRRGKGDIGSAHGPDIRAFQYHSGLWRNR